MRRAIAVRAIAVLAAVSAWAAGPAKSGYLTTSDGVRLHYLEAGQGPAILFVPGWTMPAEIWEPQIRYFSRTHRVVAMDPRSQGRSAQTVEGHYPERRARDIKEVVDELKLAPVVLVGWSLGVPEALTYVDEFGTGTLRAVILVDGRIGGDPDPKRTAAMWQWLKSMQVNRKEFASKFVRGMYKKPHPEEYLQKIIEASLKTPTNTAVTLVANVAAKADWRPVLAKLDRPVLFAGTPQVKEQAEMLKKLLPSARVEIFENAGHAVFVDEADRFNRVLEDFLK